MEKFQNGKVSEWKSVKMEKCQNPKVSESKSVRIQKCQNPKVSETILLESESVRKLYLLCQIQKASEYEVSELWSELDVASLSKPQKEMKVSR